MSRKSSALKAAVIASTQGESKTSIGFYAIDIPRLRQCRESHEEFMHCDLKHIAPLLW
jgi:hypothetical protein